MSEDSGEFTPPPIHDIQEDSSTTTQTPETSIGAITPADREQLTIEKAKGRVISIRNELATKPELEEGLAYWEEFSGEVLTAMAAGALTQEEAKGIFASIIAEKEYNGDIDLLTELPNRRATLRRAEEIFSRYQRAKQEYELYGGTEPEPITVIIGDLDHFKNINDTHGHDIGDAVLQQAAGFLKASKRTGDTAGRWGGEEFVLILPGISSETVQPILDRTIPHLADAVDEAISDMDLDVTLLQKVTMSVGVADTTMGGTFEDLIKHADKALFAAKSLGRNRPVSAEKGPEGVIYRDRNTNSSYREVEGLTPTDKPTYAKIE